MHEQVGALLWWSCQSPVAHSRAFWIIQIVSVEECSNLMWNLMQIHYCTCSVILKAMTTQYTCSLNGVFGLHWLKQWSHHGSHMRSLVHSLWLPGCINVMWTILMNINTGWMTPIPACRIRCCDCNIQIQTDYRNPVEKKGWHGHSLSERGWEG